MQNLALGNCLLHVSSNREMETAEMVCVCVCVRGGGGGRRCGGEQSPQVMSGEKQKNLPNILFSKKCLFTTEISKVRPILP